MFSAAGMAILLAALLVLYRAYKGPRIYDRVLAVNVIGTKTVALIAVVGFIFERPHFLDVALVYALINFVTTMAILKYQESRRVG